MATLHLVLGPVGSGKSTFAAQLCARHRAVALRLDEWMTRLFSPDRPDDDVMPWYVERARRCVEQIQATAEGILAADTDVVLELGLIRREQRASFFGWVDARAVDLRVYVLDAPREIRRARVEHRNRERGETFSMVVPPEVFELASDLWQPLADDESDGRAVERIATA